MELNICYEAALALKLLSDSGFDSYLVGGYIRDSIMNIPTDDVDITTSALPEEVKDVFAAYTVIETGLKHGTVTVILNKKHIEITTFRSDSLYSDGRHPDNVRFFRSLEDDLSRRDFTVNALCYNPDHGLIDNYGGIDDIRSMTLRTIGEPGDRFTEDGLRILRALRFSSVYGFNIERNTSISIHECKFMLEHISKERVYSELKKILSGKYILDILLDYHDIFSYIIPELKGMHGLDQRNFHHKYDVWEHTAHVVSEIDDQTDLRLAALFHDCGKPDTVSVDESGTGHFYSHASVSSKKAESALKALKCDNKTLETVSTLVKIHDSPIEETERAVKRKLNKYGESILRKLIALQRADTMGLSDEFRCRLDHFEKLELILNTVIAENECFSLKKLRVNGNDLIKLGYSGKEIGEALSFLLNAVIDGKVQNEKTELTEYLKNYEKK